MTWLYTFFALDVCALLALWPVAHVTSIRDLLLVLGTIIGGYLFYRDRDVYAAPLRVGNIRRPIVLIAALTVWILFVAVFVSKETLWSLDELRGQWVRTLVAFVLGGLTAAVLCRDDKNAKRFMLVLFGVFLFHVLAVDIGAVSAWYTGRPAFRMTGLTDGPDKASYLTDITIALIFGEVVARQVANKSLIRLPWWILALAFAVAFSSFYAEGIRNAAGVAVIMGVCLCWIMLTRAKHRPTPSKLSYRATLLLLGALVGLSALASVIRPAPAWERTIASVPFALDTDTYKGWLNISKYGMPKLSDGRDVDDSAYLRIAWFKEGLELAWENPLGVGYGRNAFGHAMEAKYGETKGHSHSSFIDLLLGIGFPGVALWLLFVGTLLALGFKNISSGWGSLLFFVVLDFGARMFVDSNMRDHMLHSFMFLAALLAILTVREVQAQPHNAVP
jgi:O-antigen ligase